jgi:hypothetical protein
MVEKNHTTSDLIIRQLNDKPVAQRPHDGYINATQLCKAAGKLWSNYWKNKETHEFIEELARSLTIRRDVLVQPVTTGPNDQRGTWVHPRVAYHLGQWCSPKAAVQVTAWLEELHTKGTVSLIPARATTPSEMFLAQAHINVAFEQRLVALETQNHEEQTAREALTAQVETLLARQPPVGKSTIPAWLKRTHKPYIPKSVLSNLRAECSSMEEPEKFRPDGCDYLLSYYSPYTIATAYEQVTRQLSFFTRESGQRYGR